MDDQNQNASSQAFLKIWMESFSKMAQAAMSFSPETAPPELLREMRAGILQALTQSWDEYLRSPQFMQGMKEMMDNAVAFRKLSTEFLTKARHETGGVAQEDFDGLVVAVRRLEARILERLEALSVEITALGRRLEKLESPPAKPGPGSRHSGKGPNQPETKTRVP
jgi:hypothetical protein